MRASNAVPYAASAKGDFAVNTPPIASERSADHVSLRAPPPAVNTRVGA